MDHTGTHIHDYGLDRFGRINRPIETYVVSPEYIVSEARGTILARHYEGFGYITPTFKITALGTWKSQSIVLWDRDRTLLGRLFRRHLLKMTANPLDPYPVYQTIGHLNQSMRERVAWEGRLFTTELPDTSLAYRIMVPHPKDESRTDFALILTPKWTKELMKNRPFDYCQPWPVPSFFF